MGILPILTILYGLFALGMATDVAAKVPDPPGTPALSQETDATLADAFAKSDDVDFSGEKHDADEAGQADTQVPLGFDQEVTEELAEDDSPVPSDFYQEVTEDLAEDDTLAEDDVPSDFDQEVTEDLAEDDTFAEDDEGYESQEETLDSDEDGADGEDSLADSLVPEALSEALNADSKAPIVKRVVGGRVAPMGVWPWQISIQVYRRGYRHICGGVLIRRNWVLTAAHCVDTRGRHYRVVAGEHNLNRRNYREQYFGVRRILIHPRWNKHRLSSGFDIALMRLSSNARLNRFVNLAQLSRYNRRASGVCFVTGWGYTSTRGSVSSLLRYAYLPAVSYRTCRRRTWWGRKVKRSMICAGGNGRQAGCFGDSGGPLSCYRNRRWLVYGITSFVSSRGCNVRRKPTVFTRVSSYRYWIQRVARY